jgi:hypothetical protein
VARAAGGEMSDEHYHPCLICREPRACWCPFPEKTWEDEFSVCQQCRTRLFVVHSSQEREGHMSKSVRSKALRRLLLFDLALLVAVALWASACTSVERQAYNTIVGAKAFLDTEKKAHPECGVSSAGAALRTTTCTYITKAVSAKDALISALEIYCAGPTFNASGDQGACNPPAKGTPAAAQATAKLQAAVNEYNQMAKELKGVTQ